MDILIFWTVIIGFPLFYAHMWSLGQGKYVGDANHSAVKLTTKRTPRQYMNRRGNLLLFLLQSSCT